MVLRQSPIHRYGVYAAEEISAQRKVIDAESARQSWFGLVKEPEGGRIWWSGAPHFISPISHASIRAMTSSRG